jgi:hypothetical protein
LSYSTRRYPSPTDKDKEVCPHSFSHDDDSSASGLRRRQRCNPERAHGTAIEPKCTCEPSATRKPRWLCQQYNHSWGSQCADAWKRRYGYTGDTTQPESIFRQTPGNSVTEQCALQSLLENIGVVRAAREGKRGGTDARARANTRKPQGVSGCGELQESTPDRQADSAPFRSAPADRERTPPGQRCALREQQQHRHLLDITAIAFRAPTRDAR